MQNAVISAVSIEGTKKTYFKDLIINTNRLFFN